MAERLRARTPEICQVILDRLHGMEEAAPTRDIEYLRGLREAVHRGIEYGVELLVEGQGRGLRFPVALIAQARLAARQKIPLEIVIRRYLAGKAVLGEFMLEEAWTVNCGSHLLQEALSALETEFDQLLSTVTAEYRREEQSLAGRRDSLLTKRVRDLLEGKAVDPSTLNYDLEGHHLGVVAGSPDAREVIRQLAAKTDTRPLIVSMTGEVTWAWLGSSTPLELGSMRHLAASVCSDSTPIGLGEPAQAWTGWRLTHRQAQAAFSVAQVAPQGRVHYADVSIIASAAQDPLLSTSLRALYLTPLDGERDGGELFRETLRAYFAADRNAKSAAAALDVSRQTVANRLQQVEERLGHPLTACADAVHAALRLEELGLLNRQLDIV